MKKIRKIIAIAAIVMLTGCGVQAAPETASPETPETVSLETTETTVPEVIEFTDAELEQFRKDGSLIGVGDYAILKDSVFRIADNVKFKTTAFKSAEITDKDVDLAKAGKYEAEAKITDKDGAEKTRKMNVSVFEKDEMTENLVEYGFISGVSDLTVQMGTEVETEDLIFVNPDVITLISVDDKDVNLTTAGDYVCTVTYAVDTAKAKEFEDKLNKEIEENAKAAAEEGNETGQQKADLHIPEDCDYAVVTVSTTYRVVSPETASGMAGDGTFVITPDTLNDAIAYNRESAGENAKSASEMAEAETGTEPATTVPESQVPEATTSAQEATAAQPETTTQGSAQSGSNDRPTEPATQTPPVETTIPESTTEFVPSQPQTTAHTHDWVAVTHEEPVYGVIHHPAETGQRWVDGDPIYEVHEVCYGCGLDLTAAGYTPDQMADHMDAHALAGEYEAQGNERVQVGTTEGHYENYEISPAWDETVQSGTQTIVDYYECSICKERKR